MAKLSEIIKNWKGIPCPPKKTRWSAFYITDPEAMILADYYFDKYIKPNDYK